MRSNLLATIKKKRWLLGKNTKIFRVEEAKDFVRRLGMLSAISNERLPSLANAIYTGDLRSGFEAGQRLWDFVHILIVKKWAYYGRLMLDHNMIVSMEMLPSFLRLYPPPDYGYLYEQGNLSEMGKSVMDLMEHSGPLMTSQIRSCLGVSSQRSRQRLAGTMRELQRRRLICCVGKIVQRKCRWRFSIWAPFKSWIPQDVRRRAQLLSDDEARRKLMEKYIYTAIRTTPCDIARFFSWPLNEVRSILSMMIDKELVSSYNHQGEEYLFRGNL
jgi:hypothetical protein